MQEAQETITSGSSGVTRGHLLAKDFLQALYGKESKGQITLWTLEDKKTRWYPVDDIYSLGKDAMDLRQSNNVYFGVGVRKHQLNEFQRGTNKDISSLPCVWVEIDTKDGVHAAENLPATDEVYSILNTFSLEPSIINHSGGGLHCYWLFDEPVQIRTEKDLKSAERMLSRFQNVFKRLARVKGYHIDNTSDLARVLRVPGTFNRKAEPKPVDTLKLNQEIRYSVMDLFEAIQSIEETLPVETIEKREKREFEGEIPDATRAERIVNECDFVRDYLDHKESANYNEWMAALSIAAYCEDGENLVHEWSNGHRGYSEHIVDNKYQEIRERMKPRTCSSIHQDFGKCSGCKHFNKINSPIALGMEKKEPVQKEPVKDKKTFFKRTDLGNAERLIHRHGQNIRYNNVFGKWFIWDGKRWNEDKVRKMEQLARETVRNIYKEAYDTDDADIRKSLSEHATKSESKNKLDAMVALAKSDVPILPEDMDSDIWLFNCQNGVIDLRTGELKPHNRNYTMTKISPVAYDSKAECPTWIKFLESVMQDNEGNVKHGLIEFLQRAVGYSLTGDTSEQVLFFFYGTGRNGKSTFMNVVKEILGDYGKQTNAETFTVKKSDRVNNVPATESEEGARLAESLVKQLTGGEPILARFLHQEFFEFNPQFKIFFTTNHKPIIRNSDEGIWRRIRLVPFTVTIPVEKLDKRLPEKLRAEWPGILRWAVDGCLKWQRDGLTNPKEVQEATASYREEMDTMGTFLEEFCIRHDNAKCSATTLFEKYVEWCEENGEYKLSRQKFYKKVEERGLPKQKGTGGNNFFHGIGFKTPSLVSEDNSFSSGKVETSGEKNNKKSHERDIRKNGEIPQLSSTSPLNHEEKVVPEYI
jgi:putative DNA primase/helicase